MSEATEAAAISFMQKKIPLNWLNKSYPSQKSLGSYIHDLKERISFFQVRKSTQNLFHFINKNSKALLF